MKISKRASLSRAMREEIRELEKICRDHDGTEGEVFLSSEYNFDRSIKCFFTCYDEEKPVAFLCLFIPSENEAEVTGFTHPEHRGKGLFTRLLDCARDGLSARGIERMTFVLEPASRDGAAVLAHLGAVLSESELLMARAYEELPAIEEKQGPVVETLHDGEEDILVLKKDGKEIASMNVGIGEKENCIFGFGVTEKERGKGYGAYLLARAIESYRTRLVLQVSGSNEAAVHLYKKFGFETVSRRDYYTIAP